MIDVARSKFIAGLLGPVLLALGLSAIVNREIFPDLIQQMQKDYLVIIIAGILALSAGLAIIQTHNVWSGWPAIITAFGWLLVLGGVLRIVFPHQLAEFAASMIAPNPVVTVMAGTLILIAGAFFTYKSCT